MNIAQIGRNVENAVKKFSTESFIYDFLLAYGLPKATISRLKKGNLNLAKSDNEIILKKKLHFRVVESDFYQTIDSIKSLYSGGKDDPRFIITTNYNKFLAVDTKTDDTLDTEIEELPYKMDFFLPWAGMEKTQNTNENPADIKAAEKMARLFDGIVKDNPDFGDTHAMNIFLTRLLFCLFAEDTGIFPDNIFTNSIESHTSQDGSDLDEYLDKLFIVLNQQERGNLPDYLKKFPYVNGGLFADECKIPRFSAKSRRKIIEAGRLDWADINPDIFGSMFQTVIDAEKRHEMGQHYTSVPNIMKVIKPLFLDELYEEFEKAKNEPKKLEALLNRLANIKIFDPACGSGNFLIIAFKELRLLEMKIIEHQLELQKAMSVFDEQQTSLIPKAQQTMALQYNAQMFSRIQVSQFYGIELDDFAHEVAVLALWLAEHQMNMQFNQAFETANPSLPLKEGANIVCGNATRENWNEVCPISVNDEVYVLGNPPYLGSKNQTASQKEDMEIAFSGVKNYKKLDYIGAWFIKASNYIENTNARYAFVSTNSICQGEQVHLLWPEIFTKNQEIAFAYQSFEWSNSAKRNAGITCIIVGVSAKTNNEKTLFFKKSYKRVKNISPYLIEGENTCIYPITKSISGLPFMEGGSKPTDDGNLILSDVEKDTLVAQYPESSSFIRAFKGSDDFLNGKSRWCLWITEETLAIAKQIPPINERMRAVAEFRSKSKKKPTREKALTPYRFDEAKHRTGNSIIFPVISSYRRKYVPVGFLDDSTVVSNKGQVIYNTEPYVFSILSSRLHVLWLSVTSSRLRNDYQYSIRFSYNTFPLPPLSEKQKDAITAEVFNVLGEREKHPEKTLAQLYDPDKMPEGLREAHSQLDLVVERCYRSTPFKSDEERLEYLFKLYEEMSLKEGSDTGK